jgi:hypothetical protein
LNYGSTQFFKLFFPRNFNNNNNNKKSRITKQALFMQEKNMAAEKWGSEIEVENRWHGRELP